MNVSSGPEVKPFLMFSGQAEEAMNFYVNLFDNSKIIESTIYGRDEAGKAGLVRQAVFSLNGQEIMCIDSPIKHEFGFTPAISLYVTWFDEERMVRCYKRIADGGHVLMPLDKYDFSLKFAWIQDKFGVSWQFNLSDESDSEAGRQ